MDADRAFKCDVTVWRYCCIGVARTRRDARGSRQRYFSRVTRCVETVVTRETIKVNSDKISRLLSRSDITPGIVEVLRERDPERDSSHAAMNSPLARAYFRALRKQVVFERAPRRGCHRASLFFLRRDNQTRRPVPTVG